jgi:hypothetical protein
LLFLRSQRGVGNRAPRVQAVLRLLTPHGPERLEQVCALALEAGEVPYHVAVRAQRQRIGAVPLEGAHQLGATLFRQRLEAGARERVIAR